MLCALIAALATTPATAGEHAPGLIAASRDGAVLVTAESDGDLHLWSTDPFESIAALPHDASARRRAVTGLRYSAGGDLAVSTGDGGRIEVWQARALGRAFIAHSATASAVDWLPGERLVTVGQDIREPDGPDAPPGRRDATVRIWDAGETPAAELRGLAGAARALAVSPDGGLIAAGGEGPAVVVWSAETGETYAILAAPGPVVGLGFSEGALVVLGYDGGLRASGEGLNEIELLSSIKAPAGVGLAESGWLIAARTEVVTLRREGVFPRSLPGRVYGAALAGDELWLRFADGLERIGPEGDSLDRVPVP